MRIAEKLVNPQINQSQCSLGDITRNEIIGGMTLLEHYAGLAMQGMLACQIHPASDEYMMARDAVTIARALIAELEKANVDA